MKQKYPKAVIMKNLSDNQIMFALPHLKNQSTQDRQKSTVEGQQRHRVESGLGTANEDQGIPHF